MGFNSGFKGLINLLINLKITWIKFVFSATVYRAFLFLLRGRDASVGRATHYGLYHSVFESRYGTKNFIFFRTPPNRLWGPHSPLYNEYRGSFPGLRWPVYGVNHPPPSNAEVKNVWKCTSVPPPLCLLWYVVGLILN